MNNKYFNMRNGIKFLSATALVLMLASCGGSAKEEKGELNDKKAELAKLKKEQGELNQKITKLEEEIAKADPSAAIAANVKLVSVIPAALQEFKHYIDLQGKIDADNISYVTPRGAPAQVKAVYVKEGQFVKKGQLLLKLDDAVMRQNLAQLQTQLAYAQDIYNRQKNLWDQGIGTEVQFITAKNNVDQAQRQIATLNEQLDAANVRAEVSGVAEVVNVRPGETFTGFAGNQPALVIVNTSSLKIVTDIPENYITRVRRGARVEVVVPDANQTVINSTISLISQSIDPNSRGFRAEASLPSNPNFKPNQVAVMKILDYSAKDAIVIPVNVVQSDEKGKYVYIMGKKGDKTIATKKAVIVGESYGDGIEIKSGLSAGDLIITEGYQNLYEGQAIATDVKS